jgi:glycosyltransferase involved in cell wall biosynthesis
VTHFTEKSAKIMTHSTVSVIIPLYNHERYIKEAVDSVLNQSFSDLELIIVDDGSTDKSAEIVNSIHDNRIKYIHQENRGTHAALNRGIKAASGDFISILNSDDVYHRNRLEGCLNVFHSDSSVFAVFTYLEFIDEDGCFIRVKKGTNDCWLGHNPNTSFRDHNTIVLDLLTGNFLHTTSNLVCKKEVFDDIGYFFNLRYLNDYDFLLRLAYNLKVSVLEKPLLKYRFHGSNTFNEDFAASNFETGLVLASFLMHHDLKKYFPDEGQAGENMVRFFNSINTLHTDKMILTLLLFGLKYDTKDSVFTSLADDFENPFRAACIEHIKQNRDRSLLEEALAWHKGQEDLWWTKAQELKNVLSWQKEQTDKWWARAAESEASCSWQEASCSWQKEQTHLWWDKAQKTEQKLNFYLRLTKPIQKAFPQGSKRRKWLKNLLLKFI